MNFLAFRVFILAFFLSLFSVSILKAETIKELFQSAETAMANSQYHRAIDLFEQIVERQPNFAPAYNGLGLAHREIKTDIHQIIWLFKTAINVDPKFAPAYDNLAKAYYNIGNFDQAEEMSLKALELNPNLVSAQLSLGWIYLLGKSQPGWAINYFKKAIANQPIPYAYYGLGMAYYLNDESPMVMEAITALRSLKREELAAQLENMLKNRPSPEDLSNDPLISKLKPPPQSKPKNSSSNTQSSNASPPKPAPPLSNPSAPKPSLGQTLMPVRLKGQLPKTASVDSSDDPHVFGSPENFGVDLERVERVKSLRTQAK